MDHLVALFFSPLVLSFVAAFVFTPLVLLIYRIFGHVDDPLKNLHVKVTHTEPVPRGGGLVIFFAVLVASFVFLGFDKHSIGILLGCGVLALIGFLDDLYDINPYARLLAGVFAAGLVVSSGIGIAFITNPFGSQVIDLSTPQFTFFAFGKPHSIWILADLLALIWIVWSMNMVNWAKGLDGQLPGLVVVASLITAMLSFRHTEDITQWSVVILASITAGAYLGFLPWNFYPQKIMPGYGGGSIAGFLLAVLSILSGAKLATMIIVLGVPMMDAIYTIFRRILAGKSPVWGDRGHLHHLLLDIGWSKKKVALFYWVISLFLGILALQLNSKQKMFTIVMLVVGVGGVILWLRYFINSSKRQDRDNG